MIKLNTNENPYGPTPRVKEVNLMPEKLRLYPDPDSSELVHALAKYHGLTDKQVFVGVGSDDVLAMAFLTFFHSDLPILFPDITYSFYPVWADLFGIPYERPALTEEFKIKKEDYMVPNGGIVLANPNAPTSIYEPLDTIREILAANKDSVVIVDEAYIDFGGESALSLLDDFDNLLVVRTFSKSRSMAGLRIGYAMGSEEMIGHMLAVKNSYNSYTMNRWTIVCGTISVEDEDYFQETKAKIIKDREYLSKGLRDLGFTLPDSSANFVFASHSKVPAKEIFEYLREKQIYVRYFAQPRIDNRLRITVGTHEEIDALLDALKTCLEQHAEKV